MAYRRTPRVQARLEAQRAAVVDAAAALLAESGYAGCSVSAVAARAGVAAGTVYKHFDTKVALIAEVFRSVVSHEVDVVREAAATGTAAERTTAVLETFAGRALKAPRRAYALLAEPVDPLIDGLRLEFRRAFRDVITEAISQGVATGELPPQNARLVAAALVGALGEALTGPLATEAEEPDTVPTLIEFALRAIGGVAPSPFAARGSSLREMHGGGGGHGPAMDDDNAAHRAPERRAAEHGLRDTPLTGGSTDADA